MHNFDMRRFVSYICVYAVLIIAIILPIEIYRMRAGYDDVDVPGYEVRFAERLSKTRINKKVRKLILGDSTGHALYSCDKTYKWGISLACNRAITLAGHYFLLKNFLETNPENLPEEIIILYTPFSFSCDLDQFAYQYFLKPFHRKEYNHIYTNHLLQRVQSIPMYWTANWPFVQTSGYTPRFAIPAKEDEMSISELNCEYLHKIDSITTMYDIRLSIVSTPVREDRKDEVDKFVADVCKTTDSVVLKYLQKYVESIAFYPSELFNDELHLSIENVPSNYLELF